MSWRDLATKIENSPAVAMLRNRRLRRALARLLYVPFLGWVVIKSLAESWTLFLPEKNDEHAASLAHTGMSGNFRGTAATFYAERSLVESWLPAQFTLADRDQLPDWLRRRDDHPVILMFGSMASGWRTRYWGRYDTAPVFGRFREAFFGVPFLKPVPGGPSPCFHFLRAHCSAFWPTELGISVGGWPKVQCPMNIGSQGTFETYTIRDQRGIDPWLTAETDHQPRSTRFPVLVPYSYAEGVVSPSPGLRSDPGLVLHIYCDGR